MWSEITSRHTENGLEAKLTQPLQKVATDKDVSGHLALSLLENVFVTLNEVILLSLSNFCKVMYNKHCRTSQVFILRTLNHSYLDPAAVEAIIHTARLFTMQEWSH